MIITLASGAEFRTTRSGAVRYYRTSAQVTGTLCEMTADKLTPVSAEALDRSVNVSAYVSR